MYIEENVTLCEVGLRDGLQNECKVLTIDEKLDLVNAISDAGFKIIEVGSFVNPKAVPQMSNTDELFKRMNRKKGVEYRALIANIRGVDRAIDCGCTKVKLNVSASRAHNLANLNQLPEVTVAGFKNVTEKASINHIAVSGSISMPFGSPWEQSIPIDDVKKIVAAYYECGVREISLSDASGMAVPNQVYNICTEMKKSYPDVKWILHFHNTRGMAIANIIAGMEAGVSCFDTSFSGLGGCPFVPGAAGNVASEDVLHMMDEMGIHTGIDIDAAIGIAKAVVKIVGHTTDSYILRAGKSKELIREIPLGQGENYTKK